ncbi:hypothetical protein KY347_00850 [Candidatus Woesearchaeota archaeon]|nr:hypothetical protein [Candidatus Woesearchaeota archaeon]
MAQIDYRKLIGFSKGSFVVTLPKFWVTKHNLKKGDTISIKEGAEELIFYAGEREHKKKEKSVLINVEGKSLDRIKAEIVSAYLNNFTLIEIFSKSLEDNAPVIKGILRNLSGMEVIEQTGSRIVAKDLIDINSIPIQNIIRRMDVITRSMIDDSILCIQGKCSQKSIVHRDEEVNRLYYLGFRVIKNAIENPAIMSKLETTPWKLLNDKIILSRIEKIADEQKRITRLISEEKFSKDILKRFKELSDGIKNMYCDVMKAYYNNDKAIAYEIEVTNKNLIEKCNKFLESASKEICTLRSQQKNSAKSALKLKKESEASDIFPGKNIVSISRIGEYSKATITFIKHIARSVLNMD